jgi:hypothetical protein
LVTIGYQGVGGDFRTDFTGIVFLSETQKKGAPNDKAGPLLEIARIDRDI